MLAGLVGLSLLDILVFRFLMRVAVLETLGWLAFAFLQVMCHPAHRLSLPMLYGRVLALHCPRRCDACLAVDSWPCSKAAGCGLSLHPRLQIYPRLYVSGSMYEGGWWKGLVTGWEWVVSSPLYLMLPTALIGLVAWRLCGARWRKRWLRRRADKKGPADAGRDRSA